MEAGTGASLLLQGAKREGALAVILQEMYRAVVEGVVGSQAPGSRADHPRLRLARLRWHALPPRVHDATLTTCAMQILFSLTLIGMCTNCLLLVSVNKAADERWDATQIRSHDKQKEFCQRQDMVS